jgi:hypothetical protein
MKNIFLDSQTSCIRDLRHVMMVSLRTCISVDTTVLPVCSLKLQTSSFEFKARGMAGDPGE